MKKASLFKGLLINGRKDEENGQVVLKRFCSSYRLPHPKIQKTVKESSVHAQTKQSKL